MENKAVMLKTVIMTLVFAVVIACGAGAYALYSGSAGATYVGYGAVGYGVQSHGDGRTDNGGYGYGGRDHGGDDDHGDRRRDDD
ncbi:MAG: hypothetical protein A3G18_08135 [Rhodospirillales bacterium RIFCSPLOWO2_12_FULL_58_28]|nr:MAG: hypothetical protein A3H92_04065 [Rhodospirillales bacterium RIFCSPLOWO2_02_FULL_58_16]OHC77191.1 MAG: hypothetical protein A3G18_08135 [Rhodospirillales bacterium RIFCSPLOWO2_12_FULL_58_28]